MTYKISVCLSEESPEKPPMALSQSAVYHIAKVYLDAVIKDGKTEEEAFAEVKAGLECSFHEGWAFLEKTIRDISK